MSHRPPPPPGFGRRPPSRFPVVLCILLLAAAVWQSADWFSAISTRRTPVPEPPPLTIWLFSGEADAISLPVARFKEMHPDVRIVVRRFDWNFPLIDQLPLWTGDDRPSLVQMGSTWMASAAERKLLLPLDSLTRRSLIGEEIFLPEAWRTCVRDSIPYGIPWYVETRCLFYRKDLLAHPPARWAGYHSLPRTANAKPLLLPYGEFSGLGIFLFQNGADPLKPESPQFARAAEEYFSFFRDGTSLHGDSRAEKDHLQVFAEGKFASFVTGPWIVAQLRDRFPEMRDSWAVVPLPALAGNNTSFLGGANWVIPANAPRADLAWQFIEQMSQPAMQSEWRQISGGLPAVRKAWLLADLASDTRFAPFLRQIQNARSAPADPRWDHIERAYGELIKRTAAGELTVDQMRAELKKEIVK